MELERGGSILEQGAIFEVGGILEWKAIFRVEGEGGEGKGGVFWSRRVIIDWEGVNTDKELNPKLKTIKLSTANYQSTNSTCILFLDTLSENFINKEQ